jgi:hypothetical protein
VGIYSQAVCLIDDLVDDYERWYGEIPETPDKTERVLYVPGSCNSCAKLSDIVLRRYRTEASAASERREVMMLISGAWKT